MCVFVYTQGGARVLVKPSAQETGGPVCARLQKCTDHPTTLLQTRTRTQTDTHLRVIGAWHTRTRTHTHTRARLYSVYIAHIYLYKGSPSELNHAPIYVVYGKYIDLVSLGPQRWPCALRAKTKWRTR